MQRFSWFLHENKSKTPPHYLISFTLHRESDFVWTVFQCDAKVAIKCVLFQLQSFILIPAQLSKEETPCKEMDDSFWSCKVVFILYSANHNVCS